METESRKENPLGSQPIGSLMIKFAVPSIIAMMVTAIYNIVDQIFIGQTIGTLGNAATNIAFPLSMSCTAIGLLFGIGGAANFNLCLGKRQYDRAPFFIGTAVVMMLGLGTLLGLFVEILLTPMLVFFGSPAEVLPLASEYVRITAIGFPFVILTTGGGHILRADGSPNMTMICSLSGAILNVALDALFILVFGWGMTGAALATIIGQIFSGCLVIWYVATRFKTADLKLEHFLPTASLAITTGSLGLASCMNQVGMMVTQIVLNNSLKHYGALSIYGEAIPIACAGIVVKVNQIFFSIVIGIAQGSQPIESFNYGAGNYSRVKRTYRLTVAIAFCASILAFALFQLFPGQLLSIFGSGSEEYFDFGKRFFRIYLFCTWANCVQPATAQFFASVGKPLKGMFVSLTRQILFLLPLLIVLPLLMGIDGILFAGPAADGAACAVALFMVAREFTDMTRLEQRRKEKDKITF